MIISTEVTTKKVFRKSEDFKCQARGTLEIRSSTLKLGDKEDLLLMCVEVDNVQMLLITNKEANKDHEVDHLLAPKVVNKEDLDMEVPKAVNKDDLDMEVPKVVNKEVPDMEVPEEVNKVDLKGMVTIFAKEIIDRMVEIIMVLTMTTCMRETNIDLVETATIQKEAVKTTTMVPRTTTMTWERETTTMDPTTMTWKRETITTPITDVQTGTISDLETDSKS